MKDGRPRGVFKQGSVLTGGHRRKYRETAMRGEGCIQECMPKRAELGELFMSILAHAIGRYV